MDSQNRTTLRRSGSETVSAAILNTGAPFATTGTPTLAVSGWTEYRSLRRKRGFTPLKGLDFSSLITSRPTITVRSPSRTERARNHFGP